MYIFFMDKHWFLLHKKIAYDLSVSCHWPKDIWARSRSLAGKMQNSCPVLIFLWIIIGCSYFTQWLPMGWGCVMTLTQCYLGKINVSGRKSAKIVSNPYHSYGYTFEVCSHKDRLWPVGVSWLWLKVIWTRARTLTGKVKNLYLVYMLKHYKFLFRTKIAHILNVCHDLDQGNLGKFNA